MNGKISHTGLFGILSVFLLTGCYSQLQTVDYYTGYGLEAERDRSEQIAQTRQEVREGERSISADPEESYLYGYEDGLDEGYTEGWGDAELYYFKDYETARWFRDQGFTLSAGRNIANYYNYHSGFYPYSTRFWYGRNFYSPGWRVNFRFGNWYHMNYSHWHHYDLAWYGHPYGWNYYRYPFYDPYYYGYPYYSGTYIFNNHYYGPNQSGQSRPNTIRSSGLSSNSELNRNRSRERLQTAGSGTVNGARSAGVSSTPQQRTRVASDSGSVGRTSGATVRTGGSAVRSNVDQRSSGQANRINNSGSRTPANSPGVRSTTPQQNNRNSGTIRSSGVRIQNALPPGGNRDDVTSSGTRERVDRGTATRVERSRLTYPVPNSNTATLSIQNRIHTESVGRETGLRAPVQDVSRQNGWTRLGNILLESQGYTGPASRAKVATPSTRSSGAASVNRSSGSSRSSSVGSSSGSSGSSVRSSGSSSNNRSRGN